ncbi:MAG TPA: hypothetical protein VI757_11890 [Bacteroidia bacterium]|nr:hypothetical protein [Bacteroidia bacterium]
MMKIILKINLFLLATVTISCNSNSNNDSKLTYTNNFETDYAFNSHHQGNVIKSADAHSGWFVSKIDSTQVFSTTFNMQVSDISKNPLQFVHFSAWIKMESMNSQPMMVVDVADSTKKTLEWLALHVNQQITELNEWVKVDVKFDLTDNKRNSPSNYLKIYVSNGKKEPSYVDDISITFNEE